MCIRDRGNTRLKALVLTTREIREAMDWTLISLSGLTTLDQGVQFKFPPFPSVYATYG